MNITIIGTGVYGIATAIALSMNKDNKIIMWTESEDSLRHIEETRDEFKELGGIKIPKSIKFTTSYKEALYNSSLVFIMVAAKYVGTVTRDMKPYLTNSMHFVIGSKGIEQNSCRFIDEIFKDNINSSKLAIISGPTFAIDLASLEPIGMALASKNSNTVEIVKYAYKNTNVKLRETKDVIGIEICGAIKNVIAIAAGILYGLGYKESTRSFLITESLHDIKGLIDSLGGSKKTIQSFAGVGDLLLTATSTKSRNYSYGMLLGDNDFEGAEEFLENYTVEGYYTLKSIYTLLRRRKVSMPVIDIIYDIVINGDDPRKLVEFLMKKQ